MATFSGGSCTSSQSFERLSACCVDLNADKRRPFVCNKPDILDVASVCTHAKGTRLSTLGKRQDDGTFLSRLTAEYPLNLAALLAAVVRPFVTSRVGCVKLQDWRSLLLPCPTWPKPGT